MATNSTTHGKIKSREFEYNPYNTEKKWQCGHCKRKYSDSDLFSSNKTEINFKDASKGFVPICKCGKRFHIDKWQLVDVISLGKGKLFGFLHPKVKVSTVHLELNHNGMWYETMTFIQSLLPIKFECEYEERYKTQKEAEKGHKKMVNIFNNVEFTINKNKNIWGEQRKGYVVNLNDEKDNN